MKIIEPSFGCSVFTSAVSPQKQVSRSSGVQNDYARALGLSLVALVAGLLFSPHAFAQTAPATPIASLYRNLNNTSPTALTIVMPPLPSGATSLSLQRGPSIMSMTTIATGLGGESSYNDSGLTKSTAYIYRSVAVNGSGSTTGGSVSVTTPSGNPTAPGSPVISGIGTNSLTVKVPGLPADATSLSIQRGSGPMIWTTIASGLAAGGSFTDTGLTANTSYSYRAMTVNSYGSTGGNQVSATTRGGSPTAPSKPTFSNIGMTGLTIKAPALPADAVSLTIVRGSGPFPFGGVTVATGLAGGATCTDSGLTAGTSYTYTVNAVNQYGTTIGYSASVTTRIANPTAPNLPTFFNIGITGLTVKAPSLPSDAISMQLQRGGGPMQTTIASGLAGGSTYIDSGLVANTAYSYRLVTVGASGNTTGNSATVTTRSAGPTAPSLPTFSNIGMTGLTIKTPALPADATSLNIVRGSGPFPFGGVTVATGLAGGATYNDSGLTANTGYSYQVVAVGPNGTTSGASASVATRTGNPTTPNAPTFSNIGTTSVTIKAPGLPSDAASLSIVRSTGPIPMGGSTTIATGLAAGGTYTDTGLTAGTGYTYRAVAVSASGSTTGNSATVTTRVAGAASPNLPAFSNIAPTSLTVKMPALPSDAASLSLQRMSMPMMNWSTVATGLAGGATQGDTGLTANTNYTYRVVSVNAGGSTTGGSASVTTRPGGPAAPGQPYYSSIQSTSLTVNLPALPADATSFSLQRASMPMMMMTTIATGLSGGGTYADTGLTASTNYQYQVIAVGPSGSTTGAPAYLTTPPASIGTGLILSRVRPTTLTVTLPALWNSATSLGLQRATNSNFTGATTVATELEGGASYDDSGLTPSTTYYYRAVAAAANGTTASTTTLPGLSPAPNIPAVANIGTATLTIELPALPAEATTLSIQRATNSSFTSPTTVATGLSGAATWDDSSLTPATTYYYRAVAVNSYGSTSGPGIAATTATGLAAAPNAPAAANVGANGLTLELPALPADAVSLSLQRSPNTNFSPLTTVATGLSGGATYDDSGLTPNTTYYYRAVAVNTYGSTAGTYVQAATTNGLAAAPNPPLLANITPNTLTVEIPALPAEAASLTIQRSTNSGFSPLTTLTTGIAGGGTYDDSGLTPNTAYYYRVVAVNSFGSTPGASATIVTPNGFSPAPNAPAIAKIGSSTLTVELPALPAEATSLSLQRSTTSGFSPAGTVTTLATALAGGATYDDSGLTLNTTYYYRVVAVNSFGSTTGPSVTVTTSNGLAAAPNQPTFANVVTASLTVELPALPAEATSLSIQRSLNTSFSPFTSVATGLAGGATYDDSGLTPNTTYYYRAVAVNSYGSANGTYALVTTTNGLSPAPNSPVLLNVGPSTLTVELPALPAEATSLTIQRSTSSGFSPLTTVATGLAGGATYDDSGLSPNTVYYYRLVAVNSFGATTGASALIVTTTGLAAAPNVTLFELVQTNTLTVRLPALPAEASSLTLQRSANASFSPLTTVATGLASGATYDDSGLTANTVYYYRAVAVNSFGSTLGATGQVTTLNGPAAPLAPTFTNVQPTQVNVVLPALPSGATSLSLQKKLTSAADSTYVTTASGLAGGASSAATGLTPNASYSFRAVAFNATAFTPGAAASVTTAGNAPVANSDNVSTNQNAPLAIALTATDADGDTLTCSVVGQPEHGTLTGTAPNLTYTPANGYNGPDSFTFKANDGALDSNVATIGITVVGIASPTNLSAQIGAGKVSLTWTASAGATSYKVKRATVAGGPYTEIATNVTAASYVNSSVTNATTYYYVVSAVTAGGESGNSNEASATPVADTTAPTVAITSPVTYARITNLTSVSGTVSDNLNGSGINRVDMRLNYTRDGVTKFWNGTSWGLSAVFFATATLTPNGTGYDFLCTSNFPSAADQPIGANISAFAYDQNGNSSTSVIAVFTGNDVTKPTITVTTPANNSSLTELMAIGGSISDPAGAAGEDVTGCYLVNSWLVRDLDGVQTYWNWNTQTWVSGTISAGYYTPSSTSTTWSYSKPLPSGANLVSATYTIGALVYDYSLNSQVVYSSFVIGRPLAPTGLTAGLGWKASLLTWTASATPEVTSYNVYRSASASGPFTQIAAGVTNTNYTDGGLTEGDTYYYVVRAHSSAGESVDSNKASRKIWADITSPAVSITSPTASGIYPSMPALTGIATDSGTVSSSVSGVKEVHVFLGRTWSGASEWWDAGTRTWVTSNDMMPYALPNKTETGWTRGGVDGADLPTGADYSEGSYVLKAIAYDNAGNVSLTKTAAFKIGSDTVVPTVAITSPAASSRVTSIASIAGTVSDNAGGSGVGRVDLRLSTSRNGVAKYWNGTAWGPTAVMFATATLTPNGSGYTFASSSNFPAAGDLDAAWHTITAYAYDRAGNFAAASSTVINSTDVTKPNLSITTPANGAAVTTLPAIGGTMSDPAGAAGQDVTGMYDVFINLKRVLSGVTTYWNPTSQAWQPASVSYIFYTSTPTATTWSWNAALPSGANLVPASYTITALAYDYSLNNTTVTSAFTVTALPTPANLTATGGAGQVALTWTGSAGATGYKVKRATVSGGPYTTIATGVTATSYTDSTVTNGTTYYYVVSATATGDESANSNQATAQPAVVPVNHPPVAAPQTILLLKNTSASITLTGTDSDGNTLTYTVATQPDHGTLTGTAPALTYTPATNYTGVDSFKFKVNDGTVDSVLVPITIVIIPTDAPQPPSSQLLDNQIRNDGDAGYTGTGIYSADGQNQMVSQKILKGQTAEYNVKVALGAFGPGVLRLSGTGSSDGWTVRYYQNSVDGGGQPQETEITSAIVSGNNNFDTAHDYDITIRVSADETVEVDASKTVKLDAAAVSYDYDEFSHLTTVGTVQRDVVAAVTSRDQDVDALIRNQGDGTYLGHDIFNTTGEFQSAHQSKNVDATATYEMRVLHPGGASGTLHLKAPAASPGWTVRYYDVDDDEADVTTAITSTGGWTTRVLQNGVPFDLLVTVTPDETVEAGEIENIPIEVNASGQPEKDVVRVITTRLAAQHLSLSLSANTVAEGATLTGTVTSSVAPVVNLTVNLSSSDTTEATVPATVTIPAGQTTATFTLTGVTDHIVDAGQTATITATATGYGNVTKNVTVTNIDGGVLDALIRKAGDTAYLGEGVVNTTGASQTKAQNTAANTVASYEVKVYNQSTSTATLTLKATAASSAAWTVKYLQNGVDITTAMTGTSGWSPTTATASGAAIDVTVQVTPDETVAASAVQNLTITATTAADVNASDAVVAATTKTGAAVVYKPDLWIRDAQVSGASYVGNDIYKEDGSNQRVDRTTSATALLFHLKVQNDGNVAEAFLLKGPADADGWTIRYYDGLTETTDITTAVTSPEGWTLPSVLNASASRDVLVKISGGTTGSSAREFLIKAHRIVNPLVVDAIKIGVGTQKLGGIEWTRNGTTWYPGTGSSAVEIPAIAKDTVVGFRAVKSLPNQEWPAPPQSQEIAPTWTRGTKKFAGEVVWLQFSNVTPSGSAGEVVTAKCVDELSLSVKVRPIYRITLTSSNDSVLVGAGPSTLKQTSLTATVKDHEGQPVSGAKVRFRVKDEEGIANGTVGLSGASDDDVVTGSDGLATVTWTSGTSASEVTMDAEILDANDTGTGERHSILQTLSPIFLYLTYGEWEEYEFETWSRPISVEALFKGQKLPGLNVGLSYSVLDLENVAVPGWGTAAPLSVSSGATDVNGRFQTTQMWSPITEGDWPNWYNVPVVAVVTE